MDHCSIPWKNTFMSMPDSLQCPAQLTCRLYLELTPFVGFSLNAPYWMWTVDEKPTSTHHKSLPPEAAVCWVGLQGWLIAQELLLTRHWCLGQQWLSKVWMWQRQRAKETKLFFSVVFPTPLFNTLSHFYQAVYITFIFQRWKCSKYISETSEKDFFTPLHTLNILHILVV